LCRIATGTSDDAENYGDIAGYGLLGRRRAEVERLRETLTGVALFPADPVQLDLPLGPLTVRPCAACNGLTDRLDDDQQPECTGCAEKETKAPEAKKEKCGAKDPESEARCTLSKGHPYSHVAPVPGEPAGVVVGWREVSPDSSRGVPGKCCVLGCAVCGKGKAQEDNQCPSWFGSAVRCTLLLGHSGNHEHWYSSSERLCTWARRGGES
jgi:hypothetical protein